MSLEFRPEGIVMRVDGDVLEIFWSRGNATYLVHPIGLTVTSRRFGRFGHSGYVQGGRPVASAGRLPSVVPRFAA